MKRILIGAISGLSLALIGVLALDLDVVGDASLVFDPQIEDKPALTVEGGGMLGLDVGQVADSTIALQE